MQFKDILKALREERGLSQKNIAQACNVSPTCICQLETGVRNPTGSTLVLLADFFGCTIDYLLGREDDFGNVHVQGTAPQLTAAERQLLEDFRSLSPDLQDMLTATIETWKKKSSNAAPKAKRA